MSVNSLSRPVEALGERGDTYLLQTEADLAKAATYAIEKSVALGAGGAIARGSSPHRSGRLRRSLVAPAFALGARAEPDRARDRDGTGDARALRCCPSRGQACEIVLKSQ